MVVGGTFLLGHIKTAQRLGYETKSHVDIYAHSHHNSSCNKMQQNRPNTNKAICNATNTLNATQKYQAVVLKDFKYTDPFSKIKPNRSKSLPQQIHRKKTHQSKYLTTRRPFWNGHPDQRPLYSKHLLIGQ